MNWRCQSFLADGITCQAWGFEFTAAVFTQLYQGAGIALAVGAVGFGFGVLFSLVLRWFSGRGI